MIRLCLFQPDIPQNTGAAIRLAAGFGVALDIIEPCGFPMDDSRLKRVAMDYDVNAEIKRHSSWEQFNADRLSNTLNQRLILLTTKADTAYHHFQFEPNDILMVGRESSGVPEFVHNSVDARIIIPIKTRSFNVINAASIVLSEALRQTDLLPILGTSV
jgi:tRNA (cytidine/uridine-2'-O-)-methyltransferase